MTDLAIPSSAPSQPATARSFDSFSSATAHVLELLESQLPGALVYVAHLDRARDELRYIDARGNATYGVLAGGHMELEESFCVRMADDRAPRLTNEASTDPAYRDLAIAARVGSYLGVPLEIRDGLRVGSLCAVSGERGHFSEADLRLITMMSRLLAHELEREFRERELEDLGEMLREVASTDPLTQIPNRRRFELELAREVKLVESGRRAGSTLLLADLDGFKQINDDHGHATGDAALRSVARGLHESARADDVCCRLGGDEFAVILRAVSAEEAVEAFVSRLRAALSAAGPGGTPIRFSFGSASLEPGVDAAGAIELADRRMYERKRARKRS